MRIKDLKIIDDAIHCNKRYILNFNNDLNA